MQCFFIFQIVRRDLKYGFFGKVGSTNSGASDKLIKKFDEKGLFYDTTTELEEVCEKDCVGVYVRLGVYVCLLHEKQYWHKL